MPHRSYHGSVVAQSSGLRSALRSRERVRGLTHSLYRYPARFSPLFVGQAIEEFSQPNELVLDPFVGGGTTAVEALARGRRFAGFDLNPLSLVLTRAKTTPLSNEDQSRLLDWAAMTVTGEAATAFDGDVRLHNAPRALVHALAPYLAGARRLPNPRLRDAASGILLHVGQWAVDGRAEPASPEDTVRQVRAATKALLDGLLEMRVHAARHSLRPSYLGRRRSLFLGPARLLAAGRPTNRLSGRASLVLTSPPYPRVHVLYHRWQVRGRAETPMPYWLVDSMDGLGPRHYTMGGRSQVGEETYFAEIEATWKAMRRLLQPDANVVQVVAFSTPDRQLPRYLAAMEVAGYVISGNSGRSPWRHIPNRRWYFRVRPDRGEAREVLLLHRPAG